MHASCSGALFGPSKRDGTTCTKARQGVLIAPWNLPRWLASRGADVFAGFLSRACPPSLPLLFFAILVQVAKNKIAPPFRVVEMDILFGTGIDTVSCLLDAAEDAGFFTRKGSWYSYEGKNISQVGIGDLRPAGLPFSLPPAPLVWCLSTRSLGACILACLFPTCCACRLSLFCGSLWSQGSFEYRGAPQGEPGLEGDSASAGKPGILTPDAAAARAALCHRRR